MTTRPGQLAALSQVAREVRALAGVPSNDEITRSGVAALLKKVDAAADKYGPHISVCFEAAELRDVLRALLGATNQPEEGNHG